MIGQGYRFMDSATILRQALESGRIGELRAIRILFRQYVPDLLEQDHPVYKLQHSILIDMANHHFDLIRYLTRQEFLKVTAFEYETPDNAFRYPSSAFCLLTLANGVSAVWDGIGAIGIPGLRGRESGNLSVRTQGCSGEESKTKK